ncbi:aldehyde oxidase GLOX1-like [Papaver somniferum]|uniref:aldehyde oxidase GLOX1-like n=1 Tax=Papaver somniferum TaxID=3469 RepID=UPI000E705F78|nr:aldehyde oxidase GLOX1-like [Papaver somniferum]XP_026413587.1 aldehyde oxidase GLOX1-like [Papaver somniferum]
MHTQLLPNDRVIIFDRTDSGESKILLPEESCSDFSPLIDCSAHSVELNLLDRSVRPLNLLTDTWCSSGALAADGLLIQSGGSNTGELAVRTFRPCANCDWVEDQKGLVVPRWNDYPVMPGGVSRNYPSTGSSVLLPLKLGLSNSTPDAEIFICGGAPPNSYITATKGTFLPAAKSCGRLMITAEQPQRVMEEMPIERVMGDMILLPTGDVLIINGAKKGTASWNLGREPVLNPVLYKPESSKYEIMEPSKTPRMYHSTAVLITDGRVLVGGSNPNSNYNSTGMFPTEVSVEVFSPPYLRSGPRPQISWAKPETELTYKQPISIGFTSKKPFDKLFKKKIYLENVYVTMVAPSFNTHSFSMNQRMMVLEIGQVRQLSGKNYVIDCFAPGTPNIAPPGYYLLFVVHDGTPSKGRWIHIS